MKESELKELLQFVGHQMSKEPPQSQPSSQLVSGSREERPPPQSSFPQQFLSPWQQQAWGPQFPAAMHPSMYFTTPQGQQSSLVGYGTFADHSMSTSPPAQQAASGSTNSANFSSVGQSVTSGQDKGKGKEPDRVQEVGVVVDKEPRAEAGVLKAVKEVRFADDHDHAEEEETPEQRRARKREEFLEDLFDAAKVVTFQIVVVLGFALVAWLDFGLPVVPMGVTGAWLCLLVCVWRYSTRRWPY